jgi:hypothetical protein
MTRHPLLALLLTACAAVVVIATMHAARAQALQEASGDPCRYYPREAPVAVACTGSRCVVCADGSCRQFAPVVCWTVRP